MLAKGILTAALLTASSVGHVYAQSTEVVTGNGQTAVVPEAATAEKGVSPIATEVASEYPAFNQTMNNDAISSTLLGQGFKDIHILREGSLMTVTGTRDGQDINLVYNLVEGRLIKVNGERILSEAEKAQLGSEDQAAMGQASSDPSTDAGDDETDGSGTDAGDTSTDGSGTSDGSSTDGGDTGDGDSGAGDAGSDSDGSGSDGGGDSDGGSEGSDGGGSGSDGASG